MDIEERHARLLMLKMKAQKLASNPIYSGVAGVALELVEINISMNREILAGKITQEKNDNGQT